MGIVDFINNKSSEIVLRFSNKIKYRTLSPNIFAALSRSGEGVYIVSVRNGRSFISRAVGYFSGGFSHTVPMIFTTDYSKFLTPEQHEIFSQKIKDTYKYIDDFTIDDIDAIVFGSAEMQGMRFFDLSKYNNKSIAIHKVNVNKQQEKDIIQYILDVKNVSYDFLGVLFFKLYHKIDFFNFFDSKRSVFCSELVYDAFAKVGIKVADVDNPGPGDIYNFLKDKTIYDSQNNSK